MSDAPKESSPEAKSPEPNPGPVSLFLNENGFSHDLLGVDHLGIEVIGVKPEFFYSIASALKDFGFDYLQCHGGYDEGPGQNLVCFYNLIALGELAISSKAENVKPPLREVRLKVFLSREGEPTLPSLYKIFHGADWQERETFDMFGIHFEGHPHPKRLLMPEDWKGWPLRKDYVQPDFYEMQDAY